MLRIIEVIRKALRADNVRITLWRAILRREGGNKALNLIPIPLYNVTLNRVFFRLVALLVVAIARYDFSSRLARRKNPSISLSRYKGGV